MSMESTVGSSNWNKTHETVKDPRDHDQRAFFAAVK